MGKVKLEHILDCCPIVKTDIVRAENTHLFSSMGEEFIDFESGIWCTALGHSHPRINRVMIEQMKKVVHVHYKLTCDTAEVLAVKLLNLLGFQDGKAVFLSSGSEAVELAIRLSKLISTKSKLLTFSNSYLSAYSNTSFPRDKNLWTQIDFLKCSNCVKKDCTKECHVLKNIEFDDIATFILESGNSGGRVLLPPYKLVKFLALEVKKYGGTIVANEVTTGFGRTGKWFGFNHYDIQPDIIALGKALGNGYPISAVVMGKDISDRVEEKNFAYAQSHQNDPLGCVIANEVINIFEEDNMIDRSREIGEFFFHQLKKVQSSISIVSEVRGRGPMLAMDLSISNVTEIILEKMLKKGFFIGTTPVSNSLRFYPALTISKSDILGMCTTLIEVLKEIEDQNI
ncbi:aspartate aminotransferase family protein [Wukongibacter baidiensis]|uniref:class-III pyridoxal-phosphate-dependent aminotransferase n=1 Tax=Wukongibacter baidiensis TaxID=1723361 RepID=UPI003D7F5A6B